MENSIIPIVSFLAAVFTLISGFGLGTILTPVFTIFYDVRIAIFLVAIVHLLNNFLKLFLFHKHIDFKIIKRFGILAIAGSFVGAFGQSYIGNADLKKFLGLVLIFLAVQELVPQNAQFRFPKKLDPIGGFLSGLLGGLVGNQGAIRAAFLLNYAVSKEVFIATGVVIACLIDVVRIPVYVASYNDLFLKSWPWLLLVIISTFAGTFVGKRILKEVSIAQFRKFVAVIIILMGVYFLFS